MSIFRDFFKTQSDQKYKIYTKTHQTASHFQNFLMAVIICPELPSICV